MKKMLFYTLTLSLITAGFPAFAELPTPNTSTQNQFPGNANFNNNGFNQGYNQGYNQFNYPQQYGSNGTGQYGASGSPVQKVYNTAMTAKDILWVFTGNESTFGKRLFYVFSGALDRSFVKPIENKIGNLEYNLQGGLPVQTAQNPYVNQGVQNCYDCAQQNNTNPYAQNQNAINPAIFNNSAGGIMK
jgi:hypothetical protein